MSNYANNDAYKATLAKDEHVNCAMREMTVGEHLDFVALDLERRLRAVSDLKSSLPASFLNSGFSRIAPLIIK